MTLLHLLIALAYGLRQRSKDDQHLAYTKRYDCSATQAGDKLMHMQHRSETSQDLCLQGQFSTAE
jgi:hypothetical protein